MCTLQKQLRCFNDRVATLYFVIKTNCIRQPERQLLQFILQPQYTDNLINCEEVITNALQSCSKELPSSLVACLWADFQENLFGSIP